MTRSSARRTNSLTPTSNSSARTFSIRRFSPRRATGFALTCIFVIGSPALASAADTAAAKPIAAKPIAAKPIAAKPIAAKPAPTKSGPAPRDPDGIKGISPYWEAINRGDAHFAALNFENAAKEYRSAITQDPKNALGHLRMCELSLKQNELALAREFVDSALRFAGTDQRNLAQATFLLAGIAELQKRDDEALSAWTAYKQLDPASREGATSQNSAAKNSEAVPSTTSASTGELPVKIHIASADARTQAILARKKLLADYAPVLERIRKNVEAADEATGSAASTPTPGPDDTSKK